MDRNHQPLWLVLLPSPPDDVSLMTLRAVYGSALTQILQKAADISASFSTITLLDIALPCPESLAWENPDFFPYDRLQNLLGQLYRLICLMCTEQTIDVQYGNDIDARIILFRYVDNDHSVSAANDRSSNASLLTLQSLASCSRPWQRVCSVNNEEGEVLLQIFLRLRQPSFNEDKQRLAVERFQSASLPKAQGQRAHLDLEINGMLHHHWHVAVGGTFDHLHAGHKLLLAMTALVLKREAGPEYSMESVLTIGITGDKLLEKKQFRSTLQDWYQRQAAVQQFLHALLDFDCPSKVTTSTKEQRNPKEVGRAIFEEMRPGLLIRYVEIFDAFGPTIIEESISALVLSGETRAGGKAVNEKRAEKGWPALEVYEVDVLDASTNDHGKLNQEATQFQDKISSTEIRRRLEKKGSGPAD